MLKIPIGQINVLFARISENMQLHAPTKNGKSVNFELWSDGVEADLQSLKTVMSPKNLFLPQSERLYDATNHQGHINIEPAELSNEPFAVFGVRACDAAALEVLDSVYLQEPVDLFYAARRKAGIIITLACDNPAHTCFCKTFDICASDPGGDVTTWLINDTLFWLAETDKGEALTQKLSDLFEPAENDSLEPYKSAIRAKIASLPHSDLTLDKFTSDSLLELFNSPKWDELFKACMACGTCTFLCPTCQCYDIMDYDCGAKIQRYRCWDSCMKCDFTQMAHGNIRNSQKERFRQRFMHKLVYHKDNHGTYGCVGCGRCVKCPSSVSIIKMIKGLGVEAHV